MTRHTYDHRCGHADVCAVYRERIRELEAALAAEAEVIAELSAERDRLRELVRSAFNEGVRSGMDEHRKYNGGVTWQESKACAALNTESSDD